MRVLDLFSGIGGFSLGLKRTGGFRTVAFCEIDPYCRRVLAKHWPEVPCYDDIRTLTAARLAADGVGAAVADAGHLGCDSRTETAECEARAGRIEVLCGGFPCQDISTAGAGAGIDGERSGLWREYARLVGELRPRYVLVENVAALLGRGLERVLGDLAALGYDAEWHCIPAAAVGAPHRRDRIWIVADAEHLEWRRGPTAQARQEAGYGCEDVADPNGWRCQGERQPQHGDQQCASWRQSDGCGASGRRHRPHLADTREPRLPPPERSPILGARRWLEGRAATECGWWLTEPDVGRVAHGVPARVDRLRALGNAVVPQIPELIGRAILAAEGRAQ